MPCSLSRRFEANAALLFLAPLGALNRLSDIFHLISLLPPAFAVLSLNNYGLAA